MSEQDKSARNLEQRILAVMKEVDYIQKTKKVDGANGGYFAVTHDEVAAIVRPWFIAYGVSIAPSLVPDTGRMVDTGRKTRAGNPIMRYEAEFNVAFINADNPTDREVLRIPAHAEDQGDKAPGKALSYSVKGAILKRLLLETGENEESRSNGDGVDPDQIVEIEAEMDAATNGDDLRKITEAAMATAKAAGDHYAHKRFVAHAAKRAEALGIQPAPKVPLPQAINEEPAEPPKAAAPGEPASAGLIKTVRNLAKVKGVSEGQLLQRLEKDGLGLFKSVDDISKAAGGHLTKILAEAANG